MTFQHKIPMVAVVVVGLTSTELRGGLSQWGIYTHPQEYLPCDCHVCPLDYSSGTDYLG